MKRAQKPDGYDELKRFFEVWEARFPSPVFSSDHPHHPINMLRAIEDKFGYRRAYSGLKQAVNDCLESVESLTPTEIGLLDDKLIEAGAPTLAKVLRERTKVVSRVLARARIRSAAEYYIVSSMLSDTESGIPSKDIDALGRMLVEYGNKSGA
jgi:hypothetical protein